MKIAIGCDHRGYALKEYIKKTMNSLEWVDVGTFSNERTDYPIYVKKVCDLVTAGTVDKGILICASGAGMSIAANRFKHIYAALVWDIQTAILAKEDDNANILILPANYISMQNACIMIENWLNARFKEGRYLERIQMIDNF